MTTRKSQHDTERYTTNKADQIGGAIKQLRPDWTTYLEFQDCVSIHVPNTEVVFWFGPANETFGGDIHTLDGENQLGYIETDLYNDTESVEALAAGAVKGVEDYLRRAVLAERVTAGEAEALAVLAHPIDMEDDQHEP